MSKKNDDARKELDEILAGLLTDKKKNQSDKRFIANSIRANNPVYKEKQKKSLLKTITDPLWKQEQSERMKDLFQNNEDYKNNLINGHKKRVKNPDWIKKHKENCEARKNDPDYKKQMKQIAVKRLSNESWIEGQRKKVINQYNPIITPAGCFMKYTLGVVHYMDVWNLKRGGADYRLRKLLDDTSNKDFKRITKEEYIKLTGKDPWND